MSVETLEKPSNKLKQEYQIKEEKIWSEYADHKNIDKLKKEISDLLCYIGNNLGPADPTGWFAFAIENQRIKIIRESIGKSIFNDWKENER